MNLKDLESRLQTLIEVQLLSALPGQKVEDLVVQKLAAAMHANLVTMEDGSLLAPNVYTIIVSPRSADKWREPKLLEAVIAVLKKAGEESGIKFAAPPTLSISTDQSLPSNDVS